MLLLQYESDRVQDLRRLEGRREPADHHHQRVPAISERSPTVFRLPADYGEWIFSWLGPPSQPPALTDKTD